MHSCAQRGPLRESYTILEVITQEYLSTAQKARATADRKKVLFRTNQLQEYAREQNRKRRGTLTLVGMVCCRITELLSPSILSHLQALRGWSAGDI